jgi:hypothetical protein
MKKPPKFTKREQEKIKFVFDVLRDRLATNLDRNNSDYDNDLVCGSCGDTGPFHGTLWQLENMFGMDHN